MNQDTKSAVYIILILTLIIFVSLSILVTYGDDGSGCPAWNDVVAGSVSDCYSPMTYHQNQILIQEQNQTNKLQAMNFCANAQGVNEWYDTDRILPYQQIDFSTCVLRVLNDTK